jgi:hypothetical protein
MTSVIFGLNPNRNNSFTNFIFDSPTANKKKGLLKHLRGTASRIAGTYAGSQAAAHIAGEDIGAGLYANESFLPLRVSPNPPIKRNRRKTEDGRSIQYRVKPFPDPDRPVVETKWLTEEEIEKEAFAPSTKWIEAGTGSVGKYYVEIIGCDGLPNMDFSVTGRDKTDGKFKECKLKVDYRTTTMLTSCRYSVEAFCTMVYEDCVVNSDVIHDCLSPRWPSWSQRAFVFNIMQ